MGTATKNLVAASQPTQKRPFKCVSAVGNIQIGFKPTAQEHFKNFLNSLLCVEAYVSPPLSQRVRLSAIDIGMNDWKRSLLLD